MNAVKPLINFYPKPRGAQPQLGLVQYPAGMNRTPRQGAIFIQPGVTEFSGPVFSSALLYANASDLTRQSDGGAPIGERIIVKGRVLDENDIPVPGAFIEVWQANAAGRYRHEGDQHDAPLDPNFIGQGRMLTDENGWYALTTIRPGCYPWNNHHNAWRPAHIHFSIAGACFGQRLITQMYFPGDPLLSADPFFNSIADAKARERLVARFDFEVTQPEFALGYRFDIVLRGLNGTPDQAGSPPSQSAGASK